MNLISYVLNKMNIFHVLNKMNIFHVLNELDVFYVLTEINIYLKHCIIFFLLNKSASNYNQSLSNNETVPGDLVYDHIPLSSRHNILCHTIF